MADDLLIQPLDLTDFADPGQGPDPGFTDLVASELADSGTDADGFDPVVEEMQGYIDAFDAGLAELAGAEGGDLDVTFAEILTLDPEPVRANAADFAAALPAGDQAVEDLGNLLGGSTTPAPPAPCDISFNLGSVVAGRPASQFTLGLRNNRTTPVTVESVKLTTSTPDEVRSDVPVPQTVPAGADLAGTITVTPLRIGTVTGRLEITIRESTKTTTVCYTATVVSPAATGGGGGGGAMMGGTGGGASGTQMGGGPGIFAGGTPHRP